MARGLRCKYTNKFERWDADTLCAQQYTLYVVGTFHHGAVNYLQTVVELHQCSKNGKTKRGDLHGFFRVRITLVIDDNPAFVIVVHPALDRTAALGPEHRARFTDIINADVARAHDKRHAQAARRERAVPIMRRAVRHRDARRRWVVRGPAGALKQRRGEGIHQVIGRHAHRRDLFVCVCVHVRRLRADPRYGHLQAGNVAVCLPRPRRIGVVTTFT
jgi:hypothetical protein